MTKELEQGVRGGDGLISYEILNGNAYKDGILYSSLFLEFRKNWILAGMEREFLLQCARTKKDIKHDISLNNGDACGVK